MTRSIITKLKTARRDAARTVGLSARERQCVRKYAAKLPEPQRTILAARRRGMSTTEISREMKMDRETVCRIAAKIYADLRVLMPD